MNPAQVLGLRIALGATTAIAIAYGVAWPLAYIMPLFAVMFLIMPGPWFGWKVAMSLIRRLLTALFVGLIIAEFFIQLPLLCLPLYLLLFFAIFYRDATAPPLATLFMTLGITMVPILGMQAKMASHFIVLFLFINMSAGLVFCWFFHLIIPNSLAKIRPGGKPPKRPAPPPIPSREERARLALVSTLVSVAAVMIFYSFNLVQYSLAMIYICIMAANPTTNAGLAVLRDNTIACCIGGAAIIIAFNLLVSVPNYLFLVVLSLLFSLFFASKIIAGGPKAKSWVSGFTTFLVLLGSSTSGESSGASDFYLRIAQVLFAGLFCIAAIIIVEHWLQRSTRPKRWWTPWRKAEAAGI